MRYLKRKVTLSFDNQRLNVLLIGIFNIPIQGSSFGMKNILPKIVIFYNNISYSNIKEMLN